MLNDSSRCCKLLLQHCKQLEHPSFRLQNNLNFHHFYTHSAAFYIKVCPILFLRKFSYKSFFIRPIQFFANEAKVLGAIHKQRRTPSLPLWGDIVYGWPLIQYS